MSHDFIDIKGARENNLKNIDIKIPRDKFVIMTVFPAPGKPLLPSIRFMRRDKDVMWNL